MNIRIEGDATLQRDLIRAQALLARELTDTTQRIGEKVAAVLPRNPGSAGTTIPVTKIGPHLIELWGPDVTPGQEPRPFILASRANELPDVEALYADGVDRVLRQVSS